MCDWLEKPQAIAMSAIGRVRSSRSAITAEAMQDLRRILEGRSAFYAQADFTIDTSRQDLKDTLELLRTAVGRRFRGSADWPSDGRAPGQCLETKGPCLYGIRR